jgi:hypothetical protein
MTQECKFGLASAILEDGILSNRFSYCPELTKRSKKGNGQLLLPFPLTITKVFG